MELYTVFKNEYSSQKDIKNPTLLNIVGFITRKVIQKGYYSAVCLWIFTFFLFHMLQN